MEDKTATLMNLPPELKRQIMDHLDSKDTITKFMRIHSSFLKHGKDELERRDNDQRTYHQVEYAMLKRDQPATLRVIDMYIEKRGAIFTPDPNLGVAQQHGLLHLAVFLGLIDVIQRLIELGSDVGGINVGVFQKYIHHGRHNGSVPTMRELVRARGLPSQLTDYVQGFGLTPLMVALLRHQVRAFRILAGKRAGAHLAVGLHSSQLDPRNNLDMILSHPNTRIFTLHHYAVTTNNLQFLNLADQMSPAMAWAQSPINHGTPLHLAARLGGERFIERLSAGQYVPVFNWQGLNPLHVAVENIYLNPDQQIRTASHNIMVEMIANGALANDMTQFTGKTSLMLAMEGFHYDLASPQEAISAARFLMGPGGGLINVLDSNGFSVIGALASAIIRKPGAEEYQHFFAEMVTRGANVNIAGASKSVAFMALENERLANKILKWFTTFDICLQDSEMGKAFRMWYQRPD